MELKSEVFPFWNRKGYKIPLWILCIISQVFHLPAATASNSLLVGVSIERVVSSATRKEIFYVFEWNPDLQSVPWHWRTMSESCIWLVQKSY